MAIAFSSGKIATFEGMKATILNFFIMALLTVSDNSIHQFTMVSIDGDMVPLSRYEGKAMLVVNVASECGLTPQYAELQGLYETYEGRGLVVLGFPANNFGGQEPGTDAEIKAFCTSGFDVSFPMFSKIWVKGDDMHPLYQFLTKKEKNGVLDSEVKWNFQKYLLDKNGKLVKVFEPATSVLDAEVTKEIEALL